MNKGDRHHPVRQTSASVLAGSRGSRLHARAELRVKSAAPFGGRFRFTDFVLSNHLRSNLRPGHPGPGDALRVTTDMVEAAQETLT